MSDLRLFCLGHRLPEQLLRRSQNFVVLLLGQMLRTPRRAADQTYVRYGSGVAYALVCQSSSAVTDCCSIVVTDSAAAPRFKRQRI